MATNDLVLSTCGTSLLTHGVAGPLRDALVRHANAVSPGEVPAADRAAIEAHLARRRAELAAATPAQVRAWSAELNSLLAWSGGAAPRDGLFLFLATNTWLGLATAEMAAEWLARAGAPGVVAQPLQLRDLRTASLDEFRAGLSGLVVWCEETLPACRERGGRVVFNLTGGFKSVNGFLQALAMLYADETVYLFEAGQELLRLPRLPVTLEAEAAVRAHEAVLRRLANALPVPPAEAARLPETLVLGVGGESALSEWGTLLWRRARPAIYGSGLRPTISERVALGPQFEASLKGLPVDRLRLVNERLDDLCRHVESGGAYNPRALDFKALAGNPAPPSTHECDAWSDRDARRIFCHMDGRRLVVDALRPALL